MTTEKQKAALDAALRIAKMDRIENPHTLGKCLRMNGHSEEDSAWAIEEWKKYEDRRRADYRGGLDRGGFLRRRRKFNRDDGI